MRPSELKAKTGQSQAPQRKPKFPVDERADPPISFAEADAATAANCRRHGGLIGQRGDTEGAVYLCTACKKYWRYSKRAGPSRRPLKYLPRHP